MSVASTWSAIKDTANPFVRLVTTVTTDDNSPNVPYYQTEQVKEATFQSEYGCDSVFKGLMYRLEHGTPCVQHKCLFIVKVLMLEGPATFNAKISSSMGKINSLANQDARKNSMEEAVKQLAQAIQQAVNGDSKALTRVASQGTAPTTEMAKGSYKSEFQLQQEREMKAFKKRHEKTEVVLNEKLLEQFDSRLPPTKFVAAAVSSSKKKFSPEECQAFGAAALETSSIVDVCAALDQNLKDGASPLAIRFKVLQFVEALLDLENPDVNAYFRAHQVGVQRHVTFERSDNPTKSQLTQTLAQSIMSRISALVEKPQQQAPTATQQPNAGWGSAGGFDDLFGGMTVQQRGQQPAPPRGTAGVREFDSASTTFPSGYGQFPTSTQPIAAQFHSGQPQQNLPTQHHFQQATHQFQQPQSFSPPQSQPHTVAQPQPNIHYQQNAPQQYPNQFHAQPQQPQPPQPQPPQPTSYNAGYQQPPLQPGFSVQPGNGEQSLEAQMAAFQANMQAMMKMMMQQPPQVAPPSAPPALAPMNDNLPSTQGSARNVEAAWGSSALAPPPLPPISEPPAEGGTPVEAPIDSSRQPFQANYANVQPHQAPATVAPAPAPPSPAPAPPIRPNPNQELIQQVQRQIEETTKILQQQQQMLLMLMKQQQ